MYLEEFAHSLNLDQALINQCREQIAQLSDPTNHHILIPAVVYLLCSTCEVVLLDGTKSCGNGVTLNQIISHLEEGVNVEEFLTFLSKLPRRMDVHNITIENSIQAASMSFRLYKKFDRFFSLVHPKQNPEATPQFEREDSSNYIQQLKNVSWLLYLILRDKISKEEESSPYIVSNPTLTSQLIMISTITLLGQVCDLEVPQYCQMLQEAVEMEEEIEHYQQLVQTHYGALNLRLSEETLKHTFKVLAKLYTPVTLDESCFLRQKVVFTPKKSLDAPPPTKKVCTEEQQAPPHFMQTPLKQNKFSNKTYFNIMKDNAPPQTPITRQNDKYLFYRKVQRQSSELVQECLDIRDTYIDQFTSCIKSFASLSSMEEISIQDILNLNWVVLSSLMKQELPDSLLKNEKFMFALLALSLYSQMHLESKYISHKILFQACNVEPLDVWRVIGNYAVAISQQSCQSLTKELFGLEKSILLHDINYECYSQIFGQREQELKFFQIQLKQRFVLHFDLRIAEISQVLKLQELKDQAHTILAQYFKSPQLSNTTTDTLILCTYYLLQRYRKIGSPSFTTFKELYCSYYPNKKNVFNHIVEFYNSTFLATFKPLLQGLQQPEPLQIDYKVLSQSPLALRSFEHKITSAENQEDNLKNQLASSLISAFNYK